MIRLNNQNGRAVLLKPKDIFFVNELLQGTLVVFAGPEAGRCDIIVSESADKILELINEHQ